MSNPSWKKYKEAYDAKLHPYLDVIKKYLPRSKHYKVTAAERCNEWYFRFSDGVNMSFSWRGWGDLMQAVENKNKGYMEYYM